MDIQRIISLIKQYTETNNEEYFIRILNDMNPLIKKYTYLLYYLENEDCMQELNIAIYEAIINIKHIDNDYACFTYLLKSIKHKFCKLYSQSIARQKHLEELVDFETINIADENLSLDTAIFHLDLNKQYDSKNIKEKQIINLLLNGYSDAEIGKTLGMSRQYINRMKKKLFTNLH